MNKPFELVDGRKELWQWDTNRYIYAPDCQQVHYSQLGGILAVAVVNGLAAVPNEMLQKPAGIRIMAYVTVAGNYTTCKKHFNVIARPKPPDYIYTPTEVLSYETLRREIGNLANLATQDKSSLVAAINEAYGSGTGTRNYNELSNQPAVNGVTLQGDKSAEDLGLQNEITDLEEIRNGAEAGATAYQKPNSGIPAADLSEAVRSSLAKADAAIQPNDPISDLADDASHRTVTDTEKATWNAKQSALTPDVDYATPEAVQQDISDATTDMATETWVSEQGFITADDIPVLSVNGKTGVVVLTAADLGIGSVFDLKGSVATKTALPTTGNKKGDVWYVVDESVGYIWLNDGTVDRWEMLGMSVDLSNYVTTAALASALNGYVQKVTGKGLSTNDFTDAYKTKLDAAITSLAGYATEQWVEAKGYLTEHQSLSAYRTSAAQDTIDAGKQPTISDLAAIRRGAAAGATAVQPSALNAYYTATETDAAIAAAIGDAIGGEY